MSVKDKLYVDRHTKMEALRDLGSNPYRNDFVPDGTINTFNAQYQAMDMLPKTSHKLAGRIIAINRMGKAAFCRLQDSDGKVQLYLRREQLTALMWETFKNSDLGDFIGVEGFPMRTQTGELSLQITQLWLLTKTLRPLPEKFHGLQDTQIRYRQRYLDLIVNPAARDIFKIRSKIMQFLRQFLEQRHFIEVETPLLHPMAGGAAAKPFHTHHQALACDLVLRIAPELYLKRLVVGGLERVFEIGRNFRNEGLSTLHNPEFTMLEFYVSYHTCTDLMGWTEDLLQGLVHFLGLTEPLTWGEHTFSLTKPFTRLSMRAAIAKYGGLSEEALEIAAERVKALQIVGIDAENLSEGAQIAALFGHFAEPHLIEPTFITDFPLEISPLARARDDKPWLADRFELYVAGYELANSFSELNDPIEQRHRFEQQLTLRAQGDDEAHHLDEDYLRALEHGMPPTAGFGMGIDRLTMLLTGSTAIREVILFPLLRPEK